MGGRPDESAGGFSLARARRFVRLVPRSADARDDFLSGPLRGELLGVDQLADRVRAVARNQRVAKASFRWRNPPLLARLADTRKVLDDVHARLAAGAGRGVDVGPAGEWLLDNFHVVQEHIREIHDSLPEGYYRELPETVGGALAGYPRVYELAITLISHTEARVDADNLDRVVSAFQEVAPLVIGELWAVPTMLRLGLIESVRRMSLRTVERMDALEGADDWAARIESASELGRGALEKAVDDFMHAPPRLPAAFVQRFLRQLRSTRGAFPPLERLEEWIARRSMSADVAAARSTEHLAHTQVVMAHSITSLRAISHMDWKAFVERQSVMEAALRSDPSGYYARMTFGTRDRYRHVIEHLARRTARDEESVALQAIELARRGALDPQSPSFHAHVGYYLVDDGLADLEVATGYRPGLSASAHRLVLRHPDFFFGGGILAGAAVALGALFWLAGQGPRPAWLILAAVGILPALDIAVTVVHQLITAYLPPRILPKLDLQVQGGIPAEYRTAVVIPTLFADVDAVREALDNLEVQFLANRESHLHFAVLSDFTDSPIESRAEDEALVAAAVEGVRALNERYGCGDDGCFHLLHRPRRWNVRQGVWMGWERKRGKLAEFNHFLRSGAEDSFCEIAGDVESLRKVRFVITLDADTVLPPGAAPLLVGTLAHPLNRAVYDARAGRVVRGYGILQPRVGVSLPSAHASIFASIHSGHPGVDPYTTAVSDVYQDLYGEGSFTGKGIYDVDVFEEATRGRFPENTLLSHDLIEGSYARAGLATDITLYDDYPSRYLTHARRKHRWIRGDWQLLRWLTPRVPGPDGPEPNRLPMLSRWKILDNLRRSTLEIALVIFLLAGWTVLPGSPLRWTMLGLGALTAPWLVALLRAVLHPPLDRSWRAYYAAVGRDAVTSAQQVGLFIAFLPHQAWVSADAIGRTLIRLFVTRRNLLEWQTASGAERVAGTPHGTWRALGPAVASAVGLAATALVVGWNDADAARWQLATAVLPLALIWIASPLLAHALSARTAPSRTQLTEGHRREALRYALLHWRFFDRFVTAESHWLVPDNFQEDPAPVVAMRTSPTNIGLQLLATVSALDLGFITPIEMTRRLERAFQTLERMPRLRGHFYNWYDLESLRVLEPAYVSAVDSGNLAGHLIALRQACLAIADAPVADTRLASALGTALALASERLHDLASSAAGSEHSVRAVTAAQGGVGAVRAALTASGSVTGSADSCREIATALESAALALRDARLTPELAESAGEWIEWSRRLLTEQCAWLEELGVHAGVSGAVRGNGRTSLRDFAGVSAAAAELLARLETLAEEANRYAMEMDFRLLFDEERELFAIGYRESSLSLDDAYYDLLASESRLTSFVAIAKKDVPVDHWFRLGRTLTHSGGATALVSWSGSMFEYLMPGLVMRSLPFTLLDQTCQGAVRRQVAYGSERRVPWGVSESAYNLRDRHLTYQYRAFGVPNLALKRGLSRDLVVAPYATLLALGVDPERALGNLTALEAKGALGPYGFRDALDYTRPEADGRYAVVGIYMAHHIGMGLVAITNALRSQLWQSRFHSDPMVRSAELLLHERIPRRLVFHELRETRSDEGQPDPKVEWPAVREFDTPDTPEPHIALLGRHPYTVMVSQAGGGYSRYEKLAVTRWRADVTADATGQFCYVKDLTAGRTWSTAHQPTGAPADSYLALLATDRVVFERRDGSIETRTEVVVVPEDAAEVRRVTVTNHGDEVREIELTSYGEIVLGPTDADRAHPAFANLFVETEWHPWCTAVTATRRPRSPADPSLICVHVVDTGPEQVGPVTCETDRGSFLGRGRGVREPLALTRDGPLAGGVGAVLDPIFALRTRLRLAPGQSASVAFSTLVATTRERAFELADRYHDRHTAQRALDIAWTTQHVELRELDLTPTDAAVFQELAGFLFYHHAGLRAEPEERRRNRGSRAMLWTNGISGDLPILLASIDSLEGLPTLRQLFAAHRYWRRRGMSVDLVVVDTQASSYLQELDARIMESLYASGDSGFDQPGGVFVLRNSRLRADELLMLRATARVNIRCDGRPLAEIVESAADSGRVDGRPSSTLPLLEPAPVPLPVNDVRPLPHENGSDPHSTPLLLDNGFGGLTSQGDYRIRVHGDQVPPAPWVNVIANPHGGFLVSERGAGFTWAGSSYSFRLTPWHNDPVTDAVSEVLYLRDEESGELWSATPAPIRDGSGYTATHSPGATLFTHEHDGVFTELKQGLADDSAVKLSVLRLTNGGTVARRLSVTAYAEWTLGVLREHTQHQVHMTFDAGLGAMLAWNDFEPESAGWMAFCAISERVTSHTGDRRDFLGRNGSTQNPAGLQGGALSERTEPGVDPCAALQCLVVLEPGQTRTVAVLLGAARGEAAARGLIAAYRDPRKALAALRGSVAAWEDRLAVISVRTPEPSFNTMVNRWTLYQALACRMWARSGLYQSSGAYGFRDQLQDVMAFLYAEPGIARQHILRAAARQFVEGDVQHWWHPETGRGIRTRFSDDLVWLPYVVDQYVTVTGDASILDEQVPFLTMRALEAHEHEVYDLPGLSDTSASVYEHSVRALQRACTSGAHGLPLMGTGDWNDGMNRVGVEGRGESVWLGWFLATTLRTWGRIAEARGDKDVASNFGAMASAYVAAVETHGWDGEWYRRAYFDDGSPLGSAGSEECKIDSIAQSWSVISGAGDPARQAQAMRALEEHLVRREDRLLLLLTPPFDKGTSDPGYIRGYVPGVRENGAQYTHAALWSVLATALRGEGDLAFELFQMLNPLTHTATPEAVRTYRVEPYVVAADVYTANGQLGRGGWTWYTGSASWMYRVALETLLGFQKRGDSLVIAPCVPASWGEFSIEYRFGKAVYEIVVERPGELPVNGAEVSLDGRRLEGREIPLVDDGARHKVMVRPLTGLDRSRQANRPGFELAV